MRLLRAKQVCAATRSQHIQDLGKIQLALCIHVGDNYDAMPMVFPKFCSDSSNLFEVTYTYVTLNPCSELFLNIFLNIISQFEI